ncbi:hypothetical protein RAM80_24945 [Pseudomonas sp. App30]|uniref:hypothetical protein n=1 Tax=Pseudomonas sp. App30 TaxID=3068990 RepID=UPI003A809A42
MTDTLAAVKHYDDVLAHYHTLLGALAQAPTPLAVFQRMGQRLEPDDPRTPLEKLPKAYPSRYRDYRRSEGGQAHAAAAAKALAGFVHAQAQLLHADGLLGNDHWLMAKSVYQWPELAERTRHYGRVTRAYALHLETSDARVPAIGSFVLAQAAHAPLASLAQAEEVGLLLLFTPGGGLEAFNDLAGLRQRLARLDTLRAGVPTRDHKRLGRAPEAPVTFSEITGHLFAQLLGHWHEKQLDDFNYHLHHRDLSPLQGEEWVIGLTRATDLHDALNPSGFFTRRIAALLQAVAPPWLANSTAVARKALAKRTRTLIKYHLQFQQLMNQLPSLKGFAKARVEGELRRRLKRRIDVDHLYISEARVLGIIPNLWKGLPWLIYSEVKRGRDVAPIVDKALANISPLDVDYRLTALVVDQHRNIVPGLEADLIREVVREVDVGGSYPAFVRGQIDNAAQLQFHAAFALLQRARHAVQRQRTRMGAPPDPAWQPTLQDGLLTEATLDAGFEAQVDTLMASADAASTSDRESDLHVAVTLCTIAVSAVAMAVNPWLGLAVNGLLSARAVADGVRAWKRGDHEQAVDAIGGALAGLVPVGHLPGPAHTPVALFRRGPEALQPRLLGPRPIAEALPALAEAKVDLAHASPDSDGVYHHAGRHYIRHIDSPTQVRQHEVDYSAVHGSYRALDARQPDALRQPVRRSDSMAWRTHVATLWAPELELPVAEGPPAVSPGPAAVLHAHQWVDPNLLAMAGLMPQDRAAFAEAAQLLEQGQYQFNEEEVLAPLPGPPPSAGPDALLTTEPLVLTPGLLSTDQVTVSRFALQGLQHWPLTPGQMHALADDIDRLRTLRQASLRGQRDLVMQRRVNARLASRAMEQQGYTVLGMLDVRGIEMPLCRHPHTQTLYVVSPRVLFWDTDTFAFTGLMMGLSDRSWAHALMRYVPEGDLSRAIRRAHNAHRLTPAVVVADVGLDLAHTRVYLNRLVIQRPGGAPFT